VRLFHLSHTDLDGHSCQLLTSKVFPNAKYYNANYGNEVYARLKLIAHDIFTTAKKNEKIILLITDLNLTTIECQFINTECEKLSNFGLDLTLQLLDHHISGAEQAKSHSWYKLDIQKSATLLTYEYLLANFKEFLPDENLKKYVQAVNAIDLWLETEELFEFGKVLMRLASEAKEVNKALFADEHAAYRIAVLTEAVKLVSNDPKESHIILDDSVHAIKKLCLSGSTERNTLDNITSARIVALLSKKKDVMSIHIKGKRGIFTTSVGNVSVVANAFLKENEDFDFFLDQSGKGNVGLRASGNIDVSQIAKEYFGGGGHINASGGKLPGAKEFYTYDEYRMYMENYILDKEN
jgi:uncharacterized protein